MSRATGSGAACVRLAFYGRTNNVGEQAGVDVARQYRACISIEAEFGCVTQWFYDAPHALDGRSCADISDVEVRLGRSRGDCRDLAAAIGRPDREFDAIVLAAPDRLPRQPRLQHPLLRAASTANTPVVFADGELSLNRQLAINALLLARLGVLSGMAGASMTPAHDRFPEPAADPEMRLEIRIAEGVEAERLRLEQAQVLLEVTQWLAQRQFRTGSTSKAA